MSHPQPTLESILREEDEIQAQYRQALHKAAPFIHKVCEATRMIDGATARWSAANSAMWIYVSVANALEIAGVRRILASYGFRLNQCDAVTEYPEYRYQTHDMHMPGVPGRLIVKFDFPGIEGATCGYVQTGTKTVPVYELKCEEAAS